MTTAADSRRARAERIPPAIATPRAFMHAATGGRLSGRPAHLRVLDALMLRASAEKVRAVVTIPVRMGKSELISVHTPAWYVGTFPDRRFMLGGHTAELANAFGGRARELLEVHGPEAWGVNVDRASRAKGRWDVQGHAGGFFGAGVGGGFTGRGAHMLVIDDPLKNREQAFSPDAREAQWEWLRSTALSRLEPGGSAVIVMARWHFDDLAGRAVREGWEEIRIPALCEDPATDPLGRGFEPCPVCLATGTTQEGNAFGQVPGEACFYCEGSGEVGAPLWPERMGHFELAQRRLDSGGYWWLALYQQRPPKEIGAVFKSEHFRYFHETDTAYVLGAGESAKVVAKHRVRRFTYADLAASTKTRADWTVFLTVGLTPDRELLVLDVARKRAEGSDKLALMRRTRERMDPVAFKVEDATYGLDLIADARREGLPVGAVHADADKLARAIRAAVLYEAGRIYHPAKEAPWLGAFESELLEFDSGEHDDQVDTIAYAASDAAGSRPARTSAPKGKLTGRGGRGPMSRRVT